MYEWHGWATVEFTPRSGDSADSGEAAVSRTVDQLWQDAKGSLNETVDLRAANGMMHLWLAGCRNHYTPRPYELYQAVAENSLGSYGVLYALDHDAGEQWVRYVMRRGQVHEEVDTSLSPHIPMCEDEAGVDDI